MSELESREEIDGLVARLLYNAGAISRFPTPVDDIVAVQRLHLSSSHDSPFAPNMLAQAPAPLRSLVEAFQGKLLGALDRQQRAVYLSPDSLNVQQRFVSCHEVGHDLCPWQAVHYHLDSLEQLKPDIRTEFEREANYAAVSLLFQQDVFLSVASNYPLGMVSVIEIANLFGASIHSTFWHYVEQSPEVVLGLILSRSPVGVDHTSYRFAIKNVLASPPFIRRFSFCDQLPKELKTIAYPGLATAWEGLRMSDIATGSLHLFARDGYDYLLDFELFSNKYNLFLLAMNPRLRTYSLPCC
jgi:hypothetical protein